MEMFQAAYRVVVQQLQIQNSVMKNVQNEGFKVFSLKIGEKCEDFYNVCVLLMSSAMWQSQVEVLAQLK